MPGLPHPEGLPFLHRDLTYRELGFRLGEAARGFHELMAIGLREMEVDRRAVLPFLVEEKAPRLHPVLEIGIGDVAGFLPRKGHLAFSHLLEFSAVLFRDPRRARYHDHAALPCLAPRSIAGRMAHDVTIRKRIIYRKAEAGPHRSQGGRSGTGRGVGS